MRKRNSTLNQSTLNCPGLSRTWLRARTTESLSFLVIDIKAEMFSFEALAIWRFKLPLKHLFCTIGFFDAIWAWICMQHIICRYWGCHSFFFFFFFSAFFPSPSSSSSELLLLLSESESLLESLLLESGKSRDKLSRDKRTFFTWWWVVLLCFLGFFLGSFSFPLHHCCPAVALHISAKQFWTSK